MKYLLLLLTLLLLTAFYKAEHYPYWFCSQPGQVGKEKVLVVSRVHKHIDDRDNNKETKHFDELAALQVKEWAPFYKPTCTNNGDTKKLTKTLMRIVKRAEERGFRIIYLNINKDKCNGENNGS